MTNKCGPSAFLFFHPKKPKPILEAVWMRFKDWLIVPEALDSHDNQAIACSLFYICIRYALNGMPHDPCGRHGKFDAWIAYDKEDNLRPGVSYLVGLERDAVAPHLINPELENWLLDIWETKGVAPRHYTQKSKYFVPSNDNSLQLQEN